MRENILTFPLKELFQEYFSIHETLRIGKMYFRLFNPTEEQLVAHYSQEDWNLMFPNTTEQDMKELAECCNVTILIWCEVETDIPHGMVYFEEDIHIPNKTSFHGGTWDHASKFYFEIFRSLVALFDTVLYFGIDIATTCSLENKTADKLQACFGFIETNRSEQVIYKSFDRSKYNESPVVNRMRMHSQELL